MELFEALNFWLSLGSIVLQVAALALLAAYLLRKSNATAERVVRFVSTYGLWAVCILALFASVMTLVYSEYFGLNPCPLCWWQRIFLYPQIILFAMAAWKRDRYIADYALALSIFGAGVALYHHALQIFGEGSLPCPATGVSCAQRIIFEFGYITFPFLAFSVFAFIIVAALVIRTRRDA